MQREYKKKLCIDPVLRNTGTLGTQISITNECHRQYRTTSIRITLYSLHNVALHYRIVNSIL